MTNEACWSCAAGIESQDNYCRHCGSGQGAHLPWYYQHWGIIVATVFGLGPFGLVLVWRSPRLNSTARWAYTAAISLIMAYVLWQLYQAALLVRSQAGMILQSMQGLQ